VTDVTLFVFLSDVLDVDLTGQPWSLCEVTHSLTRIRSFVFYIQINCISNMYPGR